MNPCMDDFERHSRRNGTRTETEDIRYAPFVAAYPTRKVSEMRRVANKFDCASTGVFRKLRSLVSRLTLKTILRGCGMVAALVGFVALVGGAESGTVSLFAAIPLALVLFAVEVLCLKRAE